MDYYRIIRPFLMAMDPERAHGRVVWLLKLGLKFGILPLEKEADDPILRCRIWDRVFDNPIGLSAGFDKNAEVIDAILGLGFSFLEVGGITPRPQQGNPGTRLFRLREDEALINRFGFPNDGLERISERLWQRASTRQMPVGFVGANIARNERTNDPANDYVQCVKQLVGLVDYFIINVSCPNTPGLRDLQEPEVLADILTKVKATRSAANVVVPPPILVKISPDLGKHQVADMAAVLLGSQVDGVIVSNTTTDRPDDLMSEFRDEVGGLSGRPLFQKSTKTLRDMYRLTRGEIPLIGLGGVSSGHDAYIKIRSGASLVQLYTALVYQGPTVVSRIKTELANLLREDGFTNIQEAIGVDVHLEWHKQLNKAAASAS